MVVEPRWHRILSRADIPLEDLDRIGYYLDLFQVPNWVTGLGFILRRTEVLVDQVDGVPPRRVAGSFEELKRLTQYADKLPDWDEQTLVRFRDHKGAHPFLALLLEDLPAEQRSTGPLVLTLGSLRQLALAASLTEEPVPDHYRRKWDEAYAEVRRAHEPDLKRRHTLLQLPARQFSLESVLELKRAIQVLEPGQDADLHRGLLSAVMFLVDQVLHGAGRLLVVTPPSGGIEGPAPVVTSFLEDGGEGEPQAYTTLRAGEPGVERSAHEEARTKQDATFEATAWRSCIAPRRSMMDAEEVRRVKTHFASATWSDAERITTLLFGMVIALGLSVEEILALKFGHDGDITPAGIVRRFIKMPAGRFKPLSAGTYQATHTDGFEIMLPAKLGQELRVAVKQRGGRTLGSALGLDATAADRETQKIGKQLRKVAGPRLDVGHLKRLLHDQICETTRDPIAAAVLTGPVLVRPPLLLQYRTFPVEDLRNMYEVACGEVFGATSEGRRLEPTDAMVGSRLTPDLDLFRAQVETLRTKVEAVVGDESRPLHERHNALAAYTAMTFLAAGLRPVRDLLDDPRSIGPGYAGVEEKVMTRAHGFRVLGLPTLVSKQVEAYEKHLEALAQELLSREETAPMAKAVLNLLARGDERGRLPFLFLLDPTCGKATGISRRVLREAFPEWPYPFNFGRHLAATRLLAHGASVAQVRMHLGHLELGESQAGADSMVSLADEMERIRVSLDAMVGEQGWRCIEGFLRSPMSPLVPGDMPGYIHGLLGPELREDERRDRRRKAREELKAILARTVGANPLVDKAMLAAAHREVREVMGEDMEASAHAERLIWRLARRRQELAKPLTPPPRLLLLSLPSTFWPGQPHECGTAMKVRAAFVRHLAALNGKRDRDGKKIRVTTVERAAQTILSASLFGGCFDRGRLSQLGAMKPTDLVRIHDLVCHEWTTYDGKRTSRWAWDSLTAALLANPGKGPEPIAEALRLELRRLLRLVDPTMDPIDPFETVASLGRAFWRTHASGLTWALMDGKVSATPLSPGTLTRVLSSLRLKMELEEALSGTRSPAKHLKVGGAGTLAQGRAVYETLVRIASGVIRAPAVGDSKSRPGQMRAYRQAWLKTFPQWEGEIPAAASALAEFAYHLALAGTPKDPRLKVSSLLRYVTALAPLIDEAYDEDFGALSGVRYEEIYRRVLSTRSEEEAQICGRVLVEFHRYLTLSWSAEEVDWSFLPAGAERDADANLITDREYRRALKLLYEDPGACDDRERVRQAALLLLGYRFGLRAGEVMRLRDADLILEPDRVVVDVGTNIYGGTKSTAGVRRVWLVGELDETERQLLERLKGAFWVDMKRRDPRAGLFAAYDDPRACIACRREFERIHEALRLVTGDENLRFHHLRHSFGTRLLLGLVGDRFPSHTVERLTVALWGHRPDHGEIRRLLTGECEPTPLTLQALIASLGHAAIDTTVGSYIHVMEILLQAEVERARGEIPAPAWAYVLDEPTDTVGRRLSRGREREEGPVSPFGPGWIESIRSHSVDTRRGRAPEQLSDRDQGPSHIPLRRIAVIRGLALKGELEPDEIAARVGISIGQTRTVIGAIQDLDGMVGPLGRSSDPKHRAFRVREPNVEELARWRREEPRLIRALQSWEAALEDADEADRAALKRGLKRYLAARRTIKNCWTFTHCDPLVDVMGMLQRLGVVVESFTYEGDRDAGTDEVSPIHEKLTSFGVKTLDGVSPTATRLIMQLKAGTEPFGYQGTLDRALEVLHVHLEAEV